MLHQCKMQLYYMVIFCIQQMSQQSYWKVCWIFWIGNLEKLVSTCVTSVIVMHSVLRSITFINVFWLTRKELAAANNTGKMRVDVFSSASTPRNQTTANIGRSMAAMRKDLRSASSLVLLFSRRWSLWLPSHRERSLRPSTDNVVFALKNNHTHFEYFILILCYVT